MKNFTEIWDYTIKINSITRNLNYLSSIIVIGHIITIFTIVGRPIINKFFELNISSAKEQLSFIIMISLLLAINIFSLFIHNFLVQEGESIHHVLTDELEAYYKTGSEKYYGENTKRGFISTISMKIILSKFLATSQSLQIIFFTFFPQSSRFTKKRSSVYSLLILLDIIGLFTLSTLS